MEDARSVVVGNNKVQATITCSSTRTYDNSDHEKGELEHVPIYWDGPDSEPAYIESPLPFLITYGTDLETVQVFCSKYPKSLTPYPLVHACEFGAAPGVIPFLAQQCPEAVSAKYYDEKNGDPESVPIHYAMRQGFRPGRPTEEDIKALINIFPESVTKQSNTSTTPLAYTLVGGYTDEFVDFMFDKFQTVTDTHFSFIVYHFCNMTYAAPPCQVDKNQITSALSKILPKISSLTILNGVDDEELRFWTYDAFVAVLEMIFTAKHLKSLEIDLPEDRDIVSPPSVEDFQMMLDSIISIASDPLQEPALEDLTLGLHSLAKLRYIPLVTLSLQMPHLRRLCIKVDIFNNSEARACIHAIVPTVYQILESDLPLEELILGDEYTAGKMLNDEVNKRFLTILQGNTRLKVFFSPTKQNMCGEDTKDDLTASQKINCYTRLNRCGRAKARRPVMTLAGFVGLLDAVKNDVEVHCEDDVVKVRFTLLQEAVDKWSVMGSAGSEEAEMDFDLDPYTATCSTMQQRVRKVTKMEDASVVVGNNKVQATITCSSTRTYDNSYHKMELELVDIGWDFWIFWDGPDRGLGFIRSPLPFMITYGTDFETIQVFCSKYPESLTPDALVHACAFGAAPGVIPFLVRKFPEAVFPKHFDDENGDPNSLPIHYAMRQGFGPGRPTEEDIKTLVNIFPESVTTQCTRTSTTPLAYALVGGYTDEFVGFMFDQFQTMEDTHFSFIVYYTHDDMTYFAPPCQVDKNQIMSALSKILPKISSLTILHRVDDEEVRFWTYDAFVTVLEMIFTAKHLKSLEIDLPEDRDFVSLPSEEAFQMMLDSIISIASDPLQEPALEYLKIGLHSLCYIPLVALSLQMPHLCRLYIRLNGNDVREESFHAMVPTVYQILESDLPLEELKLGDEDMGEMLNDEVNKRFWTILQGNTRLKVFFSPTKQNLCGEDTKDDLTMSQEINCYTRLNRCGRAKAQHPGTALEDFVELLAAVQKDKEVQYDKDIVKIRFTLLREAVSMWSVMNSAETLEADMDL